MRRGMWALFAVTLVFVEVVLYGNDSRELRDAVRDALGWFHRWEAPPQVSSDTIECVGEMYEKLGFVYCQPGRIIVDLDSKGSQPVAVLRVGYAGVEYRKIAEERRLLQGPPVGALRILLKAADVVRACSYDFKKTESYASRVRPYFKGFAKVSQNDQTERQILFPYVCEGDPTYHVYVLRKEEIDSVWEFGVIGGLVQEFPAHVLDEGHRNIPSAARDAARDKGRWFQWERIDSEGNVSVFREPKRYRPGDFPKPGPVVQIP